MDNALDLSVTRITRIDNGTPTKAFCDVAVNGSFVIKSVKVVDGRRGLFVSMPREQGKNGQWYEMVSPMTDSARQRITQLVLDAYQQPLLTE